MLQTLTDVPFPLFNSVLNARLAPENVDAAIEAAISRCRSRNVPMLWWTGPATRPADLGARLEAHGWVHDEDTPGMAADLAALNENFSTPPGLVIHPVRDASALQQWCRAFIAGYELPDWLRDPVLDLFSEVGVGENNPMQLYLARLDGEPVATSTLLLGVGVAGIFNVATLASARRKGIGAAVTLAPLCDARARGSRVGILSSSSLGFPVYEQLGFRPYCTLSHYIWSSENAG